VRVKLTTTPAGATIYDASDGSELANSPAVLSLQAGISRRLELRLKGYENRSITLEATEGTRHIALTPKVATTPPVTKPAPIPRPKARPRRPRPKRPDPKTKRPTPRTKGTPAETDLVNPF
jgi:hypothetical protein